MYFGDNGRRQGMIGLRPMIQMLQSDGNCRIGHRTLELAKKGPITCQLDKANVFGKLRCGER
jgi:hypothetical protein